MICAPRSGTHTHTQFCGCLSVRYQISYRFCKPILIALLHCWCQVSFTYHHALAPLIDPTSLAMEIAIHKVIYEKTWGPTATDYSKGFFPAEMAFSERAIPALVDAGIEWVIVPNNHISRACVDYPYSQSGDNNDPPNLV